jgi:hypothetical protein
VYALTEDYQLHRIDGDRVTSARLVVPAGVRRSVWPTGSVHIDERDDVWLSTAAGLYYFSHPVFSADRLPATPHTAVFTSADGLAGDSIGDLFEDSSGDLWISSMPGGAETMTIRRRDGSRFERLGAAEGLPPASQPMAFVEDTHRAVWARLREGGVVRIRPGRVTVFGVDQGLPALVTALLVDRQGSLWLGGADRLVRVRDTEAAIIRVEPVLTGLGTTVVALEQDASNRIFIGTYDGLLALDSATGALRRFSPFEGLPRGSVDTVLAAPDGALLAIANRTVAADAVNLRRLRGAAALPAQRRQHRRPSDCRTRIGTRSDRCPRRPARAESDRD